jgi:hypothetical protein
MSLIVLTLSLEMLEFVKRLSGEFRDPYTLQAIYVSLERLKLQNVSCVCMPFYDVHINRIQPVQKKFVI